MTTEERNMLALQMLEHVTPLLRIYAASSPLEFDDLRQDAAITIMRILDTQPEKLLAVDSKPYSYIAVAVKHRILDKIKYTRRRRMDSIDAHLNDDSDTTLADLLPSPYYAEPLTILLAQERIEDVLQHLPRRLPPSTTRAVRELHATAIASMEV